MSWQGRRAARRPTASRSVIPEAERTSRDHACKHRCPAGPREERRVRHHPALQSDREGRGGDLLRSEHGRELRGLHGRRGARQRLSHSPGRESGDHADADDGDVDDTAGRRDRSRHDDYRAGSDTSTEVTVTVSLPGETTTAPGTTTIVTVLEEGDDDGDAARAHCKPAGGDIDGSGGDGGATRGDCDAAGDDRDRSRGGNDNRRDRDRADSDRSRRCCRRKDSPGHAHDSAPGHPRRRPRLPRARQRQIWTEKGDRGQGSIRKLPKGTVVYRGRCTAVVHGKG